MIGESERFRNFPRSGTWRCRGLRSAPGSIVFPIFMKCCHFSVAGFFLSALLVSAAAETPAPAVKETNFLEILAKGGIMMYPLGLMSVITVLLILIFLLTIRRNAIVSDHFMNHVESMIRKRDYLGLSALSHRRNECMARITQKTLDFMTANPGASIENVREIAQAEGSHQAGLLTSRITYLADIGAIAPMVGPARHGLRNDRGVFPDFLRRSPGRAGNGTCRGRFQGAHRHRRRACHQHSRRSPSTRFSAAGCKNTFPSWRLPPPTSSFSCRRRLSASPCSPTPIRCSARARTTPCRWHPRSPASAPTFTASNPISG